MDLPLAKLRREYIGDVREIEAEIKNVASGEAPQVLYEHSQKKLDKLAERYQYNEQLGAARFKLYELQALLHYFQHRDDDALAFIRQAIETKGSSYKRAEHLIGQLQLSTHSKYSKISSHELPLQLQARIRGLRVSAIIMAIIAVISVYFIPWAVFYIILAIKLRPEKVPSRKLIMGAAIATLPLCFGLIPIFIDVKFWRMNTSLKEYEEQGAKAFISDKEFLAGAPKRKKRDIISWSILLSLVVIFAILAIAAIASSGSESSSSESVTASGSSSTVQDARQRMESLRGQYDTCSSDLETRRGSLNIYNDYEVDSFNSDVDDCEDVRLKFNSVIDEYNRLAGFE